MALESAAQKLGTDAETALKDTTEKKPAVRIMLPSLAGSRAIMGPEPQGAATVPRAQRTRDHSPRAPRALSYRRRASTDSAASEDSTDTPRGIAAWVDPRLERNTVVSRHKEELGSADVQCAICMESFVEGESVRTLPCMHKYHVNCIDKWLVGSTKCPLCKHDLL